MNKRVWRILISEVLWLMGVFLLTVLVMQWVFRYNLFTGSAYTTSGFTVAQVGALYFWPVGLLLTFIVFFIRQITLRFSNAWVNWILVLAGASVLIALALAGDLLQPFLTGTAGWTSYPPLSALEEEPLPAAHATELAILRITGQVLQMAVGISLLFIMYRWGRMRQAVHKNKP